MKEEGYSTLEEGLFYFTGFMQGREVGGRMGTRPSSSLVTVLGRHSVGSIPAVPNANKGKPGREGAIPPTPGYG